MFLILVAICGCMHKFTSGGPINAAKLTPTDLSTIRGANYRAAGAANTTDYWLHYNPADTERDLTYADRLKVNQLRDFVNCAAWQNNPAAFRGNLVNLACACDRHHIGLMITIGDSGSFVGTDGAINTAQIHDFTKTLAARTNAWILMLTQIEKCRTIGTPKRGGTDIRG